jgi:hypothetical protein
VNMGRKTQPSVSTGGIGVTQEVGNIGGLTVTGGVSVEVSPIGISISGDPSYEDPSKASISVAGSAELPGGLLGIGGGVTVNTSTGEIIGGSIGGEIGGLGINLSSNEGNVGVEFTLQIPFTPVELSLGLEFPKKKEPSVDISIPSAPPPGPFPPPALPSTGGGNSACTVIVAIQDNVWVVWDGGRYEYSFFAAIGSVQKTDNSFTQISTFYTYVSDSYPDVYTSPVETFFPNWVQTRFPYDMFTFHQSYISTSIVGISGQESEVYKALNERCHG